MITVVVGILALIGFVVVLNWLGATTDKMSERSKEKKLSKSANKESLKMPKH